MSVVNHTGRISNKRIGLLGAAIVIAALPVVACAQTSTDPGEGRYPGTYRASAGTDHSVLTITADGKTRDLLADGGVVHLKLREDGYIEGEFLMPATTGDTAVYQNLSGTWKIEGDSVRLQQQAFTYFEDLPLHLDGKLLSGQVDERFGLVHAVFVRQ